MTCRWMIHLLLPFNRVVLSLVKYRGLFWDISDVLEEFGFKLFVYLFVEYPKSYVHVFSLATPVHDVSKSWTS